MSFWAFYQMNQMAAPLLRIMPPAPVLLLMPPKASDSKEAENASDASVGQQRTWDCSRWLGAGNEFPRTWRDGHATRMVIIPWKREPTPEIEISEKVDEVQEGEDLLPAP